MHKSRKNRNYRKRKAQQKKFIPDVAVPQQSALPIKNTARPKRARSYSAYNLNNFFYGGSGAYEGAGSSRVTRNWSYSRGIADAEILGDLQILRERSRDLYRNNAVGRGAISTMTSNVIGSGLKFQSVIDRDYLGIKEELADLWETNTERKFENWAQSLDCDASRNSDFYDLQNLCFNNYLQSGECFVLLPILQRNGRFQLCVQLVEADLVQNAPGQYTNKNIRDGIEVDEYGAPVSYSVRLDAAEWKTVPAYGEKTGRPNILHIFKQERPGQSRGVPFLSSVLENIKELGRYNKSELAAAVISSMFTVFIKSNNEHALETPLNDELNLATNSTTEDDLDYTLAPGAVYRLEEDESIDSANPTRPNTAYEQFITAQLREIGMALQIPFEVLAKQYISSFSASRASRLDARKFFILERNRFARRFCKALYEEWLSEEILNMRVPAQAYFENDDIKKAWSGSRWIGEAMGALNEVVSVKAAEQRVANLFSTRSQETIEMNGGDFMQNIRKQTREAKAILELKQIEAQIKLLDEAPVEEGAI